MGQKVKITRDQITSQSGQTVTYVDDGGTMRRIKSSLLEIVESKDVTPQAETGGDASATGNATQSEEDAPDKSAEHIADATESPPSSDTPQSEPEVAAPQSTVKPKRKRTMATASAAKATKKTPPPKATAKAKTPAKAVKKTESTGVRTIGGKVVNLSSYEKSKAPGGGTSYHNGDAVASKLEGKTLDEVYAQASKVLKTDEKELRAKYKHLNAGMQRMSLGNRMRTALIPKAAK